MMEIRRVRLAWHGMACPRCFTALDLRVTYTGTCKLTPEGSEDVGNHDWDEHSLCRCMRCEFSAPVSAFQWGDAGDLLTFRADPTGETKDVRFWILGEALIYRDLDGWVQAKGSGREPTMWRVSVVRSVASTGQSERVWSGDGRSKGEADHFMREMSELFRMAEPDEEWV